MRIAWVLLAASTCGRSPQPPGLEPQPATGETGVDAIEAASSEREDHPSDLGTAPATPDPPAGSWIEAPRTIVWTVTTAGCTQLTFRPRPDQGGSISMAGVRVTYESRGDWLELGPVSRSEGDGIVMRSCYTEVRLGPGRTLGGAPLFDDEPACRAAVAGATILDDSAERVAAKCRGQTLDVVTHEIKCGRDDRYAVLAGKPGCITAALAGL